LPFGGASVLLLGYLVWLIASEFSMFDPVASSVSLPQQEEKIIRFWNERQIYEKTLAARAGAPPFVFYEGPPTANGLPHPGHCLTRAIKDLFPRYKTMRGYFCERKAGWDTHGLPVEVEVCKELGIHAKEQIEAYGVEPFIHRCIESVFRYVQQWEELTQRLGFWIHLGEAYVTFHQSYVESVWWALKTFFERGLLYEGHKIVWWWAQGGTALSSGEVGQGYREVADPSVFVRFPLSNPPGELCDTDLLVWTTTPWTLPANQFAAVKPDLEYSVLRFTGDSEHVRRRAIVASALVEQVTKKAGLEAAVEAKMPGQELVGLRYVPPFDYYFRTWHDLEGRLKEGGDSYVYWRVIAADFVTTDTGTGIVHQAPAFGEVDFDVLMKERDRFQERQGPHLFNPVAPDGKFTAEAPDYQGRWVKEADRDIIRNLKSRGLLFHQEQYLHEYPFCWRADEDPLIQYPRKSWFIRTTRFRDEMVANNAKINWLPEHIRDGRFGNFLESNVDWALSRERYWGTPLPIWVCEATGHMEAISSYEELRQKPGAAGFEVWDKAKAANPSLADHLRIHKPYIDAVTYDSPKAPGKRMWRVPDVIDCWFDSGAMPFAQWGYPHKEGSKEQFQQQFPADFISEAIDQTRGWFYSQLAISTLLFGKQPDGTPPFEETPETPYPHPFRNCIVLGLMLAETWMCTKCGKRHLSDPGKCEACGGPLQRKTEKMSKKLRNYREPSEIFNRFGADALRWYFFANQPPWNSIIYSEQAIKETIPEFLLRLWNVYSFFVIYANIDGFDPAAEISGARSTGFSRNPVESPPTMGTWCPGGTTNIPSPTMPPKGGTTSAQLTPDVLATGRSCRPPRERSELDRWVLSELNRTAAAVVERMDQYDNFNACARLIEFVDALSNWYVRRSRDRFWSGTHDADKADAYWTLYECLLTTAKLIAPMTPFLAEELWQNLAVVAFRGAGVSPASAPVESVHLCDYPTGDPALIDETLSLQMGLVREIVSLGLSARMGAQLKVRQPLSGVEVILADRTHLAWLQAHTELICGELNVKNVEFTEQADHYITYTVLPDLKRLGPRLGKRLPAVKKLLAEVDGAPLLAELKARRKVTLSLPDGEVTLDADDIQVRLQAKEGWAAAQGKACVVVLSTELTPDLIREGIAREAARTINDGRKDRKCQFTDRIELAIVTDSAELRAAIEKFRDYIMAETLAVSIGFEPLPGVEPVEVEIGDFQATIYIKVRS
jgi:isoleucyl-tRNA synthetase